MLDIGAIAGNKWVWIGGAALGAVILLSRGGVGSGIGAASGSVDSMGIANNIQSMQTSVALSQISAGVSASNSDAQVKRDLGLIDLIKNLAAVNSNTTSQIVDANAGAIDHIVSTNAARDVDQQSNFFRYSLAWRAGDLSSAEAANTNRFDLTKTALQIGASLSSGVAAAGATTAANQAVSSAAQSKANAQSQSALLGFLSDLTKTLIPGKVA